MTDKKTGRTPRHDPHHDIIINAVHSISTNQHGRIDSGLAALMALAVVAGWLLMTGGTPR